MSDNALADDLFAESPPPEPIQQPSPSKVAGSRSPDVEADLLPPGSPVKAEDGGDPQDLVRLTLYCESPAFAHIRLVWRR